MGHILGGIALAVFGAVFAASAGVVQRGNAAASKAIFQEHRSAETAGCLVAAFRVAGCLFVVAGVLVACGVAGSR
ncbi:hypothetical protein [Streptomyces seoulensis]|uniref:hypothetical protein n=1 Tax=Streptomyces seoulensis TaxID=73044 RepID=UPI0033AFEC5F